MRFTATSTIISTLAISLVAVAAPTYRRATDPVNLLVLTFADVLEQLESKFYAQALQKFSASDFTSAGFSTPQIPLEQLTVIASDESTHSTVLQSEIRALGAEPLTSCQFDFSSVLTDVKTMTAVARLVENTGVTAYLGAAHLVSDPILLTAAASILTVEARHQTILNILNAGTAIPQAFDLAFLPQEVLAIAGPFISGCDVGVKANPSLSVTNTGTVGVGTSLTFSSSAINGSTDGLFCQMLAGGLPFSISLPFNQCVVPEGIDGPVAIWITSDNQALLNDVVDRAQNKIVAGPTIAFLDTTQQTLGGMVRAASPSMSTITPDQASSIMSNASGMGPTSTSSSGLPLATPSIPPTTGGSNTYTGPSPDGNVVVNGWSNVTSS